MRAVAVEPNQTLRALTETLVVIAADANVLLQLREATSSAIDTLRDLLHEH
jgi:hypothetical protein